MSTRESIRNLYDRLGAMSIGGAIVTGMIMLMLLAVIIMLIITLVYLYNQPHINTNRHCHDYNECTGDTNADGYCEYLPKEENSNCSNWACLAPGAEGMCQYNSFRNEMECMGKCAGTCDFSETECPEIAFIDEAPTPIVNCSNTICVYTLDFGDAFQDTLIECGVDRTFDSDCCQKWLDTSETCENEYTKEHCLTPMGICAPVNSSDPDTIYYLAQCQYRFSCACTDYPQLIAKRGINKINSVNHGKSEAELRQEAFNARHHAANAA